MATGWRWSGSFVSLQCIVVVSRSPLDKFNEFTRPVLAMFTLPKYKTPTLCGCDCG